MPNKQLSGPVVKLCLIFGLTLVASSNTSGSEPTQYLGRPGGQHRILNSDMPAGVIGSARLQGRGPGPVAGYFQPVSIHGPDGAKFSLAHSSAFLDGKSNLQAGLMVGSVYRMRITEIPSMEGAELFPTVEVIDRTYPPPGLATRYPIEIYLDLEDMRSALEGQLVTRVIYLEDPQTAVPIEQTALTERPIEASANQDALEIADRFGRPVAIVRLGSVAPPRSQVLMPRFLFGSPAWAPIYQAPVYQAPAQQAATIPETKNVVTSRNSAR